MSKEEALAKANEIASIIDNVDNDQLDQLLKNIPSEDWEVFVNVMKQVLDAAYKDDKERALRVGAKYNEAVTRRNF